VCIFASLLVPRGASSVDYMGAEPGCIGAHKPQDLRRGALYREWFLSTSLGGTASDARC